MAREEKLPSSSIITREPLPNSKKIYVKGSSDEILVAMREIHVDDSKYSIPVYDTSGPYTDPNIEIDFL